MRYPRLIRIRQNFPRPLVENPTAKTREELTRLDLGRRVSPGQTVAITAGSRGVANIAAILTAVVEHVKSLGAIPFLVPAMGSHGGGTAAGQLGVLAGYGITPEQCGCEIRASMETVEVCRASEGFPVHFDRHAFSADHVIVVNRIKPHTMFYGDVESGLMKMMLIGLGKHAGTLTYHRVIQTHSFGRIVRSVAREVLEKCRILCGLGIVENAYDETSEIRGVGSHEFEEREKELLVLAKERLPRLPFEKIDTLLIDEIGKNISGAGMDTNVIGRKYNDHEPREFETPKVKWVVVRNLTPETHGNASGIGIAEFCRTRVIEGTDWNITRINCLTAGHVTAAMRPVDFQSDREILDVALPTIGMAEPHEARVVWIRNTLQLAQLECSEAYLDEVRANPSLEILREPSDMPFDSAGNLPDFVWRGEH